MILYLKEFQNSDILMMADDSSDIHLVLFTKYPEPGSVKTRLAADTSPEIASSIFGTILEHLCHNAVQCGGYTAVHICSPDAGDEERFRTWLGGGYTYLIQRGNDIGEKMMNAFADAFAQGADGVVLTGTDLPSLDCDLLKEAAHSMHDHQYCIGPAMDGGYYCIGMRRPTPRLFRGVDWSTEAVFTQTMTKMIGGSRENGSGVCKVLPPLHDIDTIVDLETWYKQQPAGSEHPLCLYIRRERIAERFFTIHQPQEST